MAGVRRVLAAAALAALSAGCAGAGQPRAVDRPTEPTNRPTVADTSPQSPSTTPRATDTPTQPAVHRPTGTVTLGFAGDVHFADELSALLSHPETALQPIRPALSRPDLMMVNLETAITVRGQPFPKTYNFRAPPSALDALDATGVDVATMANNHAADYGAVGLRDTLAAVRRSPIPVVGVGRDAASAFQPYVTSIRGTRIAVLAATTLPDETATYWAAKRDKPGVAVALLPGPRLVRAVRAIRQQVDVVIVYLHWGRRTSRAPTGGRFDTPACSRPPVPM